MEAWARYLNDQGGINGRKIKVELKDDGYNPGRAVANLKEMKDSVFLNVGLLGSAVLNAAKDDVAEYKLLTVNPYGNPAIWAKQPKDKLRYVFVNYPDYQDEGEFLVKQSVERLAVPQQPTVEARVEPFGERAERPDGQPIRPPSFHTGDSRPGDVCHPGEVDLPPAAPPPKRPNREPESNWIHRGEG